MNHEGHVCIFHQRHRALKAYRVFDNKSKNFVDYGLCPMCDRRLKTQPALMNGLINERLEELYFKLEKQEEGKKNAKANNR